MISNEMSSNESIHRRPGDRSLRLVLGNINKSDQSGSVVVEVTKSLMLEAKLWTGCVDLDIYRFH